MATMNVTMDKSTVADPERESPRNDPLFFENLRMGSF